MAIATLADYKLALQSQREFLSVNIVSSAVVAGRAYDLWRFGVPTPAIPTSQAPDNTTLGALGQLDPATGKQNSLVGARFSALNPGTYLVVDRLSHTGGLDGTAAGVGQTVNLPTPALTRYTSGEGVMAGLTIYTALGNTATTVECEYTDSDGVAGQITVPTQIGATSFNAIGRIILLPLYPGTRGVREVTGVLLAGTTGSVGNFGVTLFKPLYTICVDESSGVVQASGFVTGKTGGGVPVVEPGACLSLMVISQVSNAIGSGAILLDEN